MARKADSFEKQLKRLEEIVRLLEEGQLPLEESLKSFEEGIKLARSCNDRLGEAERRVDILLQDSLGQVKAESFEEETLIGAADDDADFDEEDEGAYDQE